MSRDWAKIILALHIDFCNTGLRIVKNHLKIPNIEIYNMSTLTNLTYSIRSRQCSQWLMQKSPWYVLMKRLIFREKVWGSNVYIWIEGHARSLVKHRHTPVQYFHWWCMSLLLTSELCKRFQEYSKGVNKISQCKIIFVCCASVRALIRHYYYYNYYYYNSTTRMASQRRVSQSEFNSYFYIFCAICLAYRI